MKALLQLFVKCLGVCAILLLGVFPLLASMSLSLYQSLVLYPLLMLLGLGLFASVEQFLLSHKTLLSRVFSVKTETQPPAKITKPLSLAICNKVCCQC